MMTPAVLIGKVQPYLSYLLNMRIAIPCSNIDTFEVKTITPPPSAGKW